MPKNSQPAKKPTTTPTLAILWSKFLLNDLKLYYSITCVFSIDEENYLQLDLR